jgi:hypothetical protein
VIFLSVRIACLEILPGDDRDIAAGVNVTFRAAANDDVESVFIDAQEEQEEV